MLQQHYVTFYSPGTFVSEETSEPIDAWDVQAAVERAGGIRERYGATPYAFRFSTKGREDHELDSRQIARSGLYYLGGRIETLAEIKARADDRDRILIANMEGNGWDRVVVNDNSWRLTQPLREDDTILDFTPPEREAANAG